MTVRRLFVLLFTLALFAMSVRETLDPDLWWHLRTGEYILANGIPRQDVFSFTVPHHDWVTHEWLSQVLMWGMYRVGGLPALMITFAGLIALSFWLVYAVSAARPYLAAFVALLAALASAIVWGARPQIFNLLLTAVFIYILEQVRRGAWPRRRLWALVPLTILWANLHSGYLLGIVLLLTYTVGGAVDRRLHGAEADGLPWPALRLLAWVTAVSFIAAALNPSGPSLWLYPFDTLGSSAMQVYIQEWQSPDFHQPPFWPFAAMLVLGMVVFRFSRRRAGWTDLLLFGGTAAAGLLSARHIPLFALAAVPIVARHAQSSLAGTRLRALLYPDVAEKQPSSPQQWLNGTLLLLALLAAVLWTGQKVMNNDTAIAARYPVKAVDYLQSSGLAGQPGYNSYNWGGYLIWRGVPVFVDGRADVYGDNFLFYYLQAFEARPNWREPLAQYDVQYVLMERGSTLTTLLLADGTWRIAYEDDIAQILIPASGLSE